MKNVPELKHNMLMDDYFRILREN